MNLHEADAAVKKVLSEKRYAHSVRVAETAEALVRRYGGDHEKIKLAALLHDYAKDFTYEQLKNHIQTYELPASLLEYHHELWHGPVAAAIMKQEFNIQDDNILNAVYYHTTGRPQMTAFEHIVFVADYTEPERVIPGVEEVRELAKINLPQATREALKKTILHLISTDSTIHPDSFLAYNTLTQQMKER